MVPEAQLSSNSSNDKSPAILVSSLPFLGHLAFFVNRVSWNREPPALRNESIRCPAAKITFPSSTHNYFTLEMPLAFLRQHILRPMRENQASIEFFP